MHSHRTRYARTEVVGQKIAVAEKGEGHGHETPIPSNAGGCRTANRSGKPYIEMYGSKESDGSRVQLAAMCPTTELWRGTMRETVLRLFGECGVKGVYMDQIAAARPRTWRCG